MEEEKKNRHITLWFILIILILAIAGLAGYVYWDETKDVSENDAERAAWLRIKKFEGELQLDSLEAAISYYQWHFENGRHADEVRELKDRIEVEKKDWAYAKYSDQVDDIEDFIRNHSNSFFRLQANRILDSLSYFDASDIDTYQSYKHYLDSFDDGMYAKQARKRIKELDSGEVSENENENAADVISNHFLALEKNDKVLLDKTIASELETYIGKSYVGKADVEKYMEEIHAIEGRHVSFALQNLVVSKDVKNHIPSYVATFFVDEIVTKSGKTDRLHFAANAKMNNHKQITALILAQQ